MHMLNCIYTLNANLHVKEASYMIRPGQESRPCAALALLLHLRNCCFHVTIDMSLCCASECTVLPVDEEDCAAVF